jgi:hypothetical protein
MKFQNFDTFVDLFALWIRIRIHSSQIRICLRRVSVPNEIKIWIAALGTGTLFGILASKEHFVHKTTEVKLANYIALKISRCTSVGAGQRSGCLMYPFCAQYENMDRWIYLSVCSRSLYFCVQCLFGVLSRK